MHFCWRLTDPPPEQSPTCSPLHGRRGRRRYTTHSPYLTFLQDAYRKLETALPFVVSLKGIGKEILLTQANLLLARPSLEKPSTTAANLTANLYDPRLILPELAASGHYEIALTLGEAFKLDLSVVFTTYTSQLLSMYSLPPNLADEVYVFSL